MTHRINNSILLILIFLTSSCLFFNQNTSNKKKLIENMDINGKIYERIQIDTSKGKIVSKEYITINGDVIPLNISNCEGPTLKISNDQFLLLVETNLKWPKNKEVIGDIYASLLIDEIGRVIEARVVKDIKNCISCSSYAKSFINEADIYEPAQCNGRPNLGSFIIKIPFRLYPSPQ